MRKYTVWAEIEAEGDEDADVEYMRVGEPEPVAEFETEAEAKQCVDWVTCAWDDKVRAYRPTGDCGHFVKLDQQPVTGIRFYDDNGYFDSLDLAQLDALDGVVVEVTLSCGQVIEFCKDHPPTTHHEPEPAPMPQRPLDPRIQAIRKDELVGKGSCTSIDEACTDSELLNDLNRDGVETPEEAVKWARDLEGLWIENATNATSGEEDCPLQARLAEWEQATKEDK